VAKIFNFDTYMLLFLSILPCGEDCCSKIGRYCWHINYWTLTVIRLIQEDSIYWLILPERSHRSFEKRWNIFTKSM